MIFPVSTRQSSIYIFYFSMYIYVYSFQFVIFFKQLLFYIVRQHVFIHVNKTIVTCYRFKMKLIYSCHFFLSSLDHDILKNVQIKRMCDVFIKNNISFLNKVKYDDRWVIISEIEINTLKRFIGCLSLLIYLGVELDELSFFISSHHKYIKQLLV